MAFFFQEIYFFINTTKTVTFSAYLAYSEPANLLLHVVLFKVEQKNIVVFYPVSNFLDILDNVQ